MIKINLLQLIGAMMFSYFLGALGILAFPMEYNTQIVGLGIFTISSFLFFIYATFGYAQTNGGKNND